jgi:hypothetical protein
MFNTYSNISFKSSIGTLVKTHPNSKIDSFKHNNVRFETIPKHLILQVMLMGDEWVMVEWLMNEKDLSDIYRKGERNVK